MLTFRNYYGIIQKKETAEGELEAVLHAQRVRAGESRNERKLPNGPLRAQSKGFS